MANDDIRTSGVQFVARDFNAFERAMRQANRLIDDLNQSLDALVDDIHAVDRQSNGLSFGGASSAVTSFTTTAKRDFLSLLSDVTIVTRGIIDLGQELVSYGVSLAGLTASYESAIVGVAKTVEGVAGVGADGIIQLTEQGEGLKQALKDLSYEAPKTFEELSAIAELGGQLGIEEGAKSFAESEEIILSFTETIAGLTETTNLNQEEAATSLAQIVNIYRGNVDDIAQTITDMGNVIVRLGNESATTEESIVNISRRIVAAGNIAGLSIDEVLGLGAAITSLGITPEAGGTAASTFLLNLNESLIQTKDVVQDNDEEIATMTEDLIGLNGKLVALEYNTGVTGRSLVDQRDAFVAAGNSAEDYGRLLGDTRRRSLYETQVQIDDLTAKLIELKDENGKAITGTNDALTAFAKGARLSVDEFRAIAEEDPSEAITLFIEGLAQIDAEGGNVVEILDDIGLGSSEARRTMLGLSSAGGLLRDSLTKANEEMSDGNALAEETALRYATLEAQWVIFDNIVRGTTESFTVAFIPAMVWVIDELGQLVLVLGDRLPLLFAAITTKVQEFVAAVGGVALDINFDPSSEAATFLDGLIDKVTNFDTQPLVDFFGLVTEKITETKELRDAFLEWFDNVKTQLSTLTIDIPTIDFSGLFTGWDLSFLTDDINALRDTVTGEAGAAILQFVQDLSADVSDFINANPEGINVFLSELINLSTAPLQNTLALLNSLVEILGGLASANDTLLQSGLLDLGQTITDALLRPLESLSTVLDTTLGVNIQEQLATIFEGIAIPQAVTNAYTDFTTALGPLITDTLPQLVERLTALYDTVTGEAGTAILHFVLDLTAAAGDFALAHAEDIGIFLRELTEISLSPLQSTIDILNGLIEVIGGLVSANDELTRSGFLDLGQSITDSVARPLDSAITLFDTLFDYNLREKLESAFSGVVIPPVFGESFDNLIASLNGLIDAIGRLVGIEIGKTGEDLTSLGDALSRLAVPEKIQAVLDFIGFFATVQVERITATVDGITAIVDVLSNLREGIAAFSGDEQLAVGDVINRSLNADLANFAIEATLGQIIQEWLASEWQTAVESFDFQPIRVTYSEKLIAGFVSITDSLDWVAVVGSTATEFARSLAQGIQDAINELSSGEFLDATSLASSISYALQNALNTISSGEFDLKSIFKDQFTDVLSGIDLGTPYSSGLVQILSTGKQELQDIFAGALDLVDLGFPTLPDLSAKLGPTLQGIKEQFIGLLNNIDLGVPSFESLTTVIDGVIAKITEKFQQVEIFGFKLFAPDTSELDSLPDKVEATGEDTGEGFAQGIKNKLDTAVDAAIETLGENPFDRLTAWLESESPSKRYMRVGQDVIAGFVEGLANLEPIDLAFSALQTYLDTLTQNLTLVVIPGIQALGSTVDSLVSQALTSLATMIVQSVIPDLENWNESDVLVSDTIMSVVIPAIGEMESSSWSLDAVLNVLIETVNRLSDALRDNLVVQYERVVDLQRSAKDTAKDMIEVIKELAENYERLAAAVEAVNEAGTGVPLPPTTGNTPGDTGAGAGGAGSPPSFAVGGAFTVPEDIPSNLRGPTGGMLVEVHPKEYVQVFPDSIAKSIQSLPLSLATLRSTTRESMPISGVPISNIVNNTQNTNAKTEYNLHIRQAPSSAIQDSFELLKAVAGS